MNKNIKKRILVYILGLFLYSLGIAISAKAELGIAPVSTLPYAMSYILPLSFGVTTFIMTTIYIAIQVFILGKKFEKRQYLQFLVGLLFSVFIDLTMLLLSSLELVSYISKLVTLLIGCLVLSVGIVLSVVPNVITPPAEGAIAALAKRFNLEFGNMKIIFDSTIVILSIVVSLVFLKRLVGFKEGTLISVIVSGLATKLILNKYGKVLENFFNRGD